MNGTNILKAAPMMGAILAERRSFAVRTRWTTRKSVVQYPMAITAPRPKTAPVQCMPMALSLDFPITLQRWV